MNMQSTIETSTPASGTFDEIPPGTFKESGTGVASVMFHAIKGSAADA